MTSGRRPDRSGSGPIVMIKISWPECGAADVTSVAFRARVVLTGDMRLNGVALEQRERGIHAL